MKRLAVTLVGLILAACGSDQPTAQSEPPASASINENDFDLHGAFQDRTPYRGHEPFAGIVWNPAYGVDAFVLRFYNYWTGFEDTQDAQRHVLIRRSRAFDVQDGKLVLLDRGVDHWVDSRTCPAILEAMNLFPAALPSVAPTQKAQSGDAAPYSSEEARQRAQMEWSIGHCDCLDVWATLHEDVESGDVGYRLNIETGGHPADSKLGRWTSALLNDAEGCFRPMSPDVPILTPEN